VPRIGGVTLPQKDARGGYVLPRPQHSMKKSKNRKGGGAESAPGCKKASLRGLLSRHHIMRTGNSDRVAVGREEGDPFMVCGLRWAQKKGL